MLVHIHLSDDGERVLTSCPQCDALLPVRVTSFLQHWYVGQVCLRCRSTGWILGCYETPNLAQEVLIDFLLKALRQPRL